MKKQLFEQLEIVLGQIRSGEKPNQIDLVRCLCAEDKDLRCAANYRIAETFLEISDLDNAYVCINRAWLLSDFSPEFIPLFVKINLACNDIAAIKQAYKQLGVKESASINIDGALNYFNLWQYAAVNYLRKDSYDYDFDVLRCVDRLANPYKLIPEKKHINKENKIKLAYLVFGITHTNSVLVKINKIMARYHDKEIFDVAFFVPDSVEEVVYSPQGNEHVEEFITSGCKVYVAPDGLSKKDRLLYISSKIYDFKADLLITSALLADFEHYFIAATRPAPFIVGLLQGPPAQYAAPILDWVLSWSPHPLIDAPCNGSLVHFEIELPDREKIRSATRKDFDLPEDSRILMSVGRAEKFQLIDYWVAVLEILKKRQDSYYVVVGIEEQQLHFVDDLKKYPEWQRVKLLGWRKDCLNIMCLAEVILDTFPSGGGHVLADAMALAIPFVSFENNYLKSFDQAEWSVVDNFADIPDLIIQRYDFNRMKEIIFRLLDDPFFYNSMATVCKKQIHLTQGNPSQGIKRCEEIYLKLLTTRS